jgi:nucleoside-diphosphate-sugar epimerase
MKAMSLPLPPEDLEHIFHHAGGCWSHLDGKRVLFAGASGFFGSWMLESLLYAGTKSGLPFRAIALTRDARRFSESLPHLAGDPRVEILESDVATMPVPDGPIDYVVHSLVPDPGTVLPEMDAFFRSATGRLLDFAVHKSSRAFLLCSTGAVYLPKVPPNPFSEDDPLVPLDGAVSYGQIRRRVEDQCRNALSNSPVALKIARGFTFAGPRLPLDGQFAVGNFIRDALAGGPIIVKGDGSPIRSYLYAADMAAWLWTILLKGETGRAFNVGSEESVSIGKLAQQIGSRFHADVCLGSKPLPGAAPCSFLPNISRAESELGLTLRTPLCDGLQSMADWYRRSP